MTEEQILANILEASARHPMVDLGPNRIYRYGTAGFRTASNLLEGPVFRLGLLAGLRSRTVHGQAIGVMITASHNPPQDNGAKVVDPMGEMLLQEFEAHATRLVNAKSDQELVDTYKALCLQLRIDICAPAKVVYARDTRPSGHTLVAALADACQATGTEAVDYKILTTPQLHYITRCLNTEGTPLAYGTPTEAGYYEKMATAFHNALRGFRIQGPLFVDCANGVGGPKMRELLRLLSSEQTGLDLHIVNDDVLRPEALNSDCGADYVKTRQRAPPMPRPVPGTRCCSLDGDADRLIYYYIDPERSFVMLDGDRISSLIASFITELFDSAGIDRSAFNIGVIQTAYANGASTTYIRERLGLPVTCTATGVKYLHHAATKYDVGVYFEANGHGTVLFSNDAMQEFRTHRPQSPAQKSALDTLVAISDLINQAVGDAISDMLLVEIVLAHKGWTLLEWSQTYTDLPNRLVRVEVRDKDVFRTTDAERRLSHPLGAQDAIDSCVEKYSRGRAFARASGTENACRVYAEASTRHEAEELASKVAEVVRKFSI